MLSKVRKIGKIGIIVGFYKKLQCLVEAINDTFRVFKQNPTNLEQSTKIHLKIMTKNFLRLFLINKIGGSNSSSENTYDKKI